MMKNVYLLYSGYFGTKGVVIGAYQKKKDAIAEIKQSGKYEYNRSSGLYYGENMRWFKIDKFKVIGLK